MPALRLPGDLGQSFSSDISSDTNVASATEELIFEVVVPFDESEGVIKATGAPRRFHT